MKVDCEDVEEKKTSGEDRKERARSRTKVSACLNGGSGKMDGYDIEEMNLKGIMSEKLEEGSSGGRKKSGRVTMIVSSSEEEGKERDSSGSREVVHEVRGSNSNLKKKQGSKGKRKGKGMGDEEVRKYVTDVLAKTVMTLGDLREATGRVGRKEEASGLGELDRDED